MLPLCFLSFHRKEEKWRWYDEHRWMKLSWNEFQKASAVNMCWQSKTSLISSKAWRSCNALPLLFYSCVTCFPLDKISVLSKVNSLQEKLFVLGDKKTWWGTCGFSAFVVRNKSKIVLIFVFFFIINIVYFVSPHHQWGKNKTLNISVTCALP